MCKFGTLVFILLLCSVALSTAAQLVSKKKPSRPWQTLHGKKPLVIARGGFSGIFPDSSANAYLLPTVLLLPNVFLWCDVQLTKDGVGICIPGPAIQDNSNIALLFPNKLNTYTVNGVSMEGWFSVDFTLNDLANVSLAQAILSRPNTFDNQWPIITPLEVAQLFSPGPGPGLWLNIQHDTFFSQQGLSMRSFVLSAGALFGYISSPEVNFLRSIFSRIPSTTKLVFQFLEPDKVDPSTNQTYGSLLKNLTFIKTFASGILVPKTYIWPVDRNLYLLPPSSLVLDAHTEGLEVFASGFANDFLFPYNFSYDPVAEYLSYIDNGNFSVDGVLSDFPITPTEAIDCFSHIGAGVSGQPNRSLSANPLVISSKGASCDYPGCTNLAYQQAILDGVNVLDCPVQMSKDGIPVCLGSINLLETTTAAQSIFANLTQSIPKLGGVTGIFTFSLTWSQIQSLTPAITNPYANKYKLFCNLLFQNSGTFMTLSEFLSLASNASSLSGVLISIEDAAYLAENQGLSVVDAVIGALKNASLHNQTVEKVMIQSSNSSVLVKFKQESSYDLVYLVSENIRDADISTITEIKTFANAVTISKDSVFPTDAAAYITGTTEVVQKLHAFDLLVYVELFRNEFVSQAWDFFSDATVEINNFAKGVGVDGVISEFPGTAAKYKKNSCLAPNPVYNMTPVPPRGLLSVLNSSLLPPAEAPYPVLTESDVVEAPLPATIVLSPPPLPPPPPSGKGNGSTAAPPPATPPPSGEPKVVEFIVLTYVAVSLATLALF